MFEQLGAYARTMKPLTGAALVALGIRQLTTAASDIADKITEGQLLLASTAEALEERQSALDTLDKAIEERTRFANEIECSILAVERAILAGEFDDVVAKRCEELTAPAFEVAEVAEVAESNEDTKE